MKYKLWAWALPAATTAGTLLFYLAVSNRWPEVTRLIGSHGPPVAFGLALVLLGLSVLAVFAFGIVARSIERREPPDGAGNSPRQ